MDDSASQPQQGWIIPLDPEDMAPLPALLLADGRFSLYDRKRKCFDDPTALFPGSSGFLFESFESCRQAMIEVRAQALQESQQHCRKLALSIEHIRTIPTATFPNVQREVRAQGQQEQQEGQGQKKEQGQGQERQPEVTQAPKPELKRPTRKSNAQT